MPVKKRYLLPLLLLMTMTPAMAGAQELTQLFGAAKEGLTTGLTRGAAMAYAGMAQELIDRAVACPAAALEGCVGMLELNDILARQGGQTGIEALAGAGKYPYGLLAPAE